MYCHFCYLTKILCTLNLSLYWKVSQPNFHAKLRKTIKWARKIAIKIKAKRKRRKEKRDRNRFAKFWLMRMCEKQKSCLHPISRKLCLLVSNLSFIFSYSHANWPKNGSKRKIWSKMR